MQQTEELGLYHPATATPIYSLLVRFVDWVLSGGCMIRDKHTQQVRPLKFNPAQEKLIQVMLDWSARGKPVKVLVPKSRKRGISTVVQAWDYFAADNSPNCNALTVAHRVDDTMEIFSIAKRIHQFEFQKRTGLEKEGHRGTNQRTSTRYEIRFPHNGSKYRCMTAMGNYAASGSDTHFLHVSEAALLETKSNQDAENLAAMINSMPPGEGAKRTTLVLESTGNGPFGIFPQMCKQAAKGVGDYALCFISWLEDPDLTDNEFRGGFDDFENPKLTDYERGVLIPLGATPQQLSWRRRKIQSEIPGWRLDDGNPAIFGYHFPAVLDECFASVSGAVYPLFSVTRHVRGVDLSKGRWEHYRSVDWGWQGNHPFVCLWVAHDRTSPPRLTVDPSCENLISEFQAYCVDEKTGQPKKEKDHGMDAIRYLCTTSKLTGHVHVYREMFIWGAVTLGPAGVARRIHEHSGWYLPDGENPADLGKYVPGPDAYETIFTVADKAQGEMITQFSNWGIQTTAYTKPDKRENSRGEVWDGIMDVSKLLAGNAEFFSKKVDESAVKLAEAYRLKGLGRLLTDEQAEIIRNDRWFNRVAEGDEQYIFAVQ